MNFITYAYGAVRLSALSGHQVIYIMTHDSIGLGEDGPTHQPIENIALLTALPNCNVWRPADGNETSAAYLSALLNTNTPTVLSLSRQNLPQLKTSSIEKAMTGAYVVNDEVKDPKVVIVSTGSEVSISLEAADLLKSSIQTRVVSMPNIKLFESQSQKYKESLFPRKVPIISVEALSTLLWHKLAHASVGIDTFGYSGPAQQVYEKCGITPTKIMERISAVLDYYKDKEVPYLYDKF